MCNLEVHVVLCRPSGCQFQEGAQWLCGAPQLIQTGFCARVAGNVKDQCRAAQVLCASMAKASCASVSKHAMYFCAVSRSAGHTERTSAMWYCSENHAVEFAVTIQPPMPTVSPCAIASAAA